MHSLTAGPPGWSRFWLTVRTFRLWEAYELSSAGHCH